MYVCIAYLSPSFLPVYDNFSKRLVGSFTHYRCIELDGVESSMLVDPGIDVVMQDPASFHSAHRREPNDLSILICEPVSENIDMRQIATL
jgi:hypothetical protein